MDGFLVNLFKLRKHSAPTPPKRNNAPSISLWPSGGSQAHEAAGKGGTPPFPQVPVLVLWAYDQRERGGSVGSGEEKDSVPSRLFPPALKVQLSPY